MFAGEIQSASQVQFVLHNDVAAVSASRLRTLAHRFQYVNLSYFIVIIFMMCSDLDCDVHSLSSVCFVVFGLVY